MSNSKQISFQKHPIKKIELSLTFDNLNLEKNVFVRIAILLQKSCKSEKQEINLH